MNQAIKIIVEHYPDGYVAYPLGMKGMIVGQGDTRDAALADVTSAIRFHLETFGDDMFDEDEQVIDAFVTEAKIAA